MTKGLRTRQKLVYRTDSLRPRNPVALAVRGRAAGPPGSAAGALRQLAKRRLRRRLLEES